MPSKNRAMLVLAATLFITPIFAATPASAERTIYRRTVNSRRVSRKVQINRTM